jgi:hypothetical protein
MLAATGGRLTRRVSARAQSPQPLETFDGDVRADTVIIITLHHSM